MAGKHKVDASGQDERGRKQSARVFPVYTAVDTLKLPDPDELVEEVLPEGGVGLLYGSAGACKTFTALDLAFSVASGREFVGHAVKRRPVLFIAAEGQLGIKQRLSALLQEHGTPANLVLFFILEPIQLADVDDVEKLKRTLAEFDVPPALIIFDTFHRCTSGVDENSSKDIGIVLNHVEAIRKTINGNILLVHHSGKDASKGARGSSALDGAVDTLIRCHKSGDLIELHCKKQKDAAPFDPITLKLKQVDIGGGQSSCVIERASPPARSQENRERDILNILAGFGSAGARHGELKRACVETPDISPSAFDRAWRELKESPVVEKGPDDHYYYRAAANDNQDET